MKVKVKGEIYASDLTDMIEKGGNDEMTIRCFFMLCFYKLLFTGSENYVTGRDAFRTKDLRNIGHFDWCAEVVNELREVARAWHLRRKNFTRVNTISGCCVFLLIYYIDHLRHPAAADLNEMPRCAIYTPRVIKEIISADRMRDVDGKDTFGTLSFRDTSKSCYSKDPDYVAPVSLEGLPNPINDTGDISDVVGSMADNMPLAQKKEILDAFAEHEQVVNHSMLEMKAYFNELQQNIKRSQNKLCRKIIGIACSRMMATEVRRGQQEENDPPLEVRTEACGDAPESMKSDAQQDCVPEGAAPAVVAPPEATRSPSVSDWMEITQDEESNRVIDKLIDDIDARVSDTSAEGEISNKSKLDGGNVQLQPVQLSPVQHDEGSKVAASKRAPDAIARNDSVQGPIVALPAAQEPSILKANKNVMMKNNRPPRPRRKPAKYVSPLKAKTIEHVRTELATPMRAAICGTDAYDKEVFIMSGESMFADGQLIKESFNDGCMLENVFMQMFIHIIDHDDRLSQDDWNQQRIFLPWEISNMVNIEEFSPTEQYSRDDCVELFNNHRSYHDFNKAKLIFIPMLHHQHWTVYFFNMMHERIDVMNSLDYEPLGTDPMDHHGPINSDVVPRLCEVMSICCRKKYENMPRWRLNFVDVPKQAPGLNDCGFFASRFMRAYDGEKFLVESRTEDGSLYRDAMLYMLIFHCSNKSCPPSDFDQFRPPRA